MREAGHRSWNGGPGRLCMGEDMALGHSHSVGMAQSSRLLESPFAAAHKTTTVNEDGRDTEMRVLWAPRM